MPDWKLPWAGGCRCGAVRFRITAPPLLTVACHCLGCQRMTASAFSLSVGVPTTALEVTGGEPTRGGVPDGDGLRHCHCPTCKSWLWTRFEPDQGFVNVRATMLDQHGWFVPFVEMQTAEQLPWATTPATRSYARFPDMAEYPALLAAFAASGIGPG